MSLDLIATIYDETPQGGTVESPVPLTGVSSFKVDSNTITLPIPRPLRRVGDVKDKCVTRVKSVYDKRIVLDGTEIWTEYTNEDWQGAGYHVYKFYDADALPSQYIVSNKYPSRRRASDFKGTLGVTSGTQSILFSVVEQKTVDDWKAYLSAQKAAGTPLIIYHQSTAYDGTNGLDVCLTEYQTGFVELDGTEKNLIDWESILTQFSTHAEVTKSISGNTITLSGTPTDVYRQIQVSNILISPSIRGKSATLSANISGNQPALVLRQYNESNVKITETNMTGTGAVQITISPDTAYLQIILCLNRQTTGTAFMASYGDVQLELGDVTFQDYGNFKRLFLDLNSSALSRYSLEFSHGEVGAIPTIAGGLAASFNDANLYRLQILGAPDTWTTLGVTDTTTAKTWLAAQKEAGTPVQVAYQLATPEVYATDPLDIYVTTMFPVVVSIEPITYEVIPQIHPFKTDWKIQPKTPEGYYNGDWFEIEDYNHILDNYQTIYKIAKALYPDLQIPTFVSPTLGAPTKASEINTIERTIDAFKTLTIALSDVGATKTWLDNGNLFNFEDINRWEQVALSYYTVFLGQVELLPKLQFKLGGAQF